METCENGNQSLERLKATANDDELRFDLVLTDLQMPVMDGFESTKRFRVWEEEQQKQLEAEGLSRRPNQIIFGMSANSDAESIHEALGVGMDDFLAKPFQYKELEKLLEMWAAPIDRLIPL